MYVSSKKTVNNEEFSSSKIKKIETNLSDSEQFLYLHKTGQKVLPEKYIKLAIQKYESQI